MTKARAQEAEGLSLRMVPLAKARLWDRNPKRHDLGAIIASIRRYGFKDPPKFEPSLDAFAEGNGRTEALLLMQRDGEPRPRGIAELPGGEWALPVLFGVDAASRAEAEAYGVDHNNLTVAGGDGGIGALLSLWEQDDFATLLASLAAADAAPVTLDGDDIDGILAQAGRDLEPMVAEAGEMGGIQPLNLRFGRRLVEMTQDELDRLEAAFCRYAEGSGSGYGFVAWLLDGEAKAG